MDTLLYDELGMEILSNWREQWDNGEMEKETEKLLELHWNSSCKEGEKINPFTKTQTFTLTYLKQICRAASVFWIKLIEISAVYG